MIPRSLLSGRVGRWLLVLVVALAAGLGGLAAACGSSEAPATSTGATSTTQAVTTTIQPLTTSSQTAATAQTTTSTQATTTASPAHEIQVFKDIRFMSERNADRPPLLDVYAPKQAGPWPLVVMLPGGFEPKDTYMSGWATKVAERGAVVFVPDWIRIHEMPATSKELRAALIGMVGDIAAAVRFARGTGARLWRRPRQPHALRPFGRGHGGDDGSVQPRSRFRRRSRGRGLDHPRVARGV